MDIACQVAGPRGFEDVAVFTVEGAEVVMARTTAKFASSESLIRKAKVYRRLRARRRRHVRGAPDRIAGYRRGSGERTEV